MICLDHVHNFSSNMAQTLRFYQTMFGAKLVYDAVLMEQRNVRFDIGRQAMHIYDQKPRGTGRGLVHHLGIRTDDLDGSNVTEMMGASTRISTRTHAAQTGAIRPVVIQ